MRIQPSSQVIPLAALVLGISCGVTQVVDPARGEVLEVSISPALDTLRSIGATRALSLTMRTSDGSAADRHPVVWSSTDADVVQVDEAGRVTAKREGHAKISAKAGERADTADIVVSQVTVSVLVHPASVALVEGETRQLVATAYDANGHKITDRTVSWSSDRTQQATVTSGGMVEARKAGTAVVTASIERVSGGADIAVTSAPLPPVATVDLSPVSASLDVGATQQFTAIVKDSSGNVLTGRSISWSSTSTGVATVSGTGLATAVTPGSTTVRATVDNVVGDASVTVTDPPIAPVASVSVSPETLDLEAGDTRQYTATVRDVDGNILTGRVIEWSSSNSVVASVSGGGVVAALAAGTALIRATSEGVTGSGSLTVFNPPPPPPPSLSGLPVASGQVPMFQQVQFPAAGGSYADPVTAVRIWRVTDQHTAGGSVFQHYYGTANHISMPYETNRYHVLFIRESGGTPMLADVQRGQGISNVRAVPVGAVQRAAFSRVLPHILYYVSGSTLNRYNVQTMALENTAPFPKTLARGDFESLLLNESDEWFTLMGLAGTPGLHAWNRLTDQQLSNASSAKDQYALTAGGYVMVVAGAVYQWHLPTGAMEATGMPTEATVEHPDGMGGYFIARDANTREVYRFDPTTKQRTLLFGAAGHTNGSQHFSGRWYQGTGTTQWALGSFFGGDEIGLGSFSLHAGQIYKTTSVSFNWAENKVAVVLQGSWGSGRWLTAASSLATMQAGSFFWDAGARTLYVWQNGGGSPAVRAWDPRAGFAAITLFRIDGSEHRLLAHHYSSAGVYYAQPRALISPDGRLIMWTSDLNGSGRRDILIAEVP